MIKASITNSEEFQRMLKRYNAFTENLAIDGLKDMARAGARQLATRCKPFGLSAKAMAASQGAVAKDVSKAYSNAGHTFNRLKEKNRKLAYAYAKAINNGDYVAAEKIVKRTLSDYKEVRVTADPSHLESLRGANGRVQSPDRVALTTNQEYGEIREAKLANAGLSKSAWLEAGKSLGAKTRIPKWLRNANNAGDSTVKDGRTKVVTLHNRLDYASGAIRSGDIRAAVKRAEKGQISRMQKILDKKTKKL